MKVAARAPDRFRFERLPGWEFVEAGLADLADGRQTIAAVLVASASRRLSDVGIEAPAGAQDASPERLYELVSEAVGERRAHARYNALRRRLASFLRAAAHAPTG